MATKFYVLEYGFTVDKSGKEYDLYEITQLGKSLYNYNTCFSLDYETLNKVGKSYIEKTSNIQWVKESKFANLYYMIWCCEIDEELSKEELEELDSVLSTDKLLESYYYDFENILIYNESEENK